MFKRLLYKIGAWLVRKGGGLMFPVPSEVVHVFPRTRHLIDEVDVKNLSGEGKKHQVYAQLIKDYPLASRRNLALAIELGCAKNLHHWMATRKAD